VLFLQKIETVRFLLIPSLAFLLFSCGGNGVSSNDNKDTVRMDSLTWLNQKIKSDPTNLPVLFERAKYYLAHTEVDLAQKDLELYMKMDSTNLEVHKNYADIMLSKLDLENGKYHYEYVISRDSNNAAAYLGMGKLHALLDNYADAIAYLNQSLRIDPYNTEPYFMKGMIYRSDFYATGRKESWDMGVSSFQTAIEQDPENYSAYIQLGVMYDQVGDSTAVEYYNSALDIYPQSMEAWYNKGMYYQNRGRIEEALESYRTIRSIDSTWADPYYNQGYIYLLINENLDSAVWFFSRAVELDPGYYQAYNNLGLAYEKKKDLANAKYYYTKAVEINPDFKLAKDNLNRLR
jgi:tetratricopeptide (TPR) repeat protein